MSSYAFVLEMFLTVIGLLISNTVFENKAADIVNRISHFHTPFLHLHPSRVKTMVLTIWLNFLI